LPAEKNRHAEAAAALSLLHGLIRYALQPVEEAFVKGRLQVGGGVALLGVGGEARGVDVLRDTDSAHVALGGIAQQTAVLREVPAAAASFGWCEALLL
jgi:hypothetical protein